MQELILKDLLKFLKIKKIDILIDVRSLPWSKYFSDFNDYNLSKTLAQKNIKYENWKSEFGARQSNMNFYTDNVLDYQKFAKSEQFQKGIEKLNQNKNICLMCAEIDPINCYRAILCAREIALNNFEVVHIIAKRNGETIFETQSDFEKRLLDFTKTANLYEAYQKQNRKIACRL